MKRARVKDNNAADKPESSASTSAGGSSEDYEDFLLGGPIPDPRTLSDEDFKKQLIAWFYKTIRLHNEHLYSERSHSIIKRIIVENVKRLEPAQREMLTRWFLDARFISVFSLFQARIENPTAIQNLVKHFSKKYKVKQEDLYEIITVSHSQIWGTFISDMHSLSFRNILLELIEEDIQTHSENQKRLERLKSLKEQLETAFSIVPSVVERSYASLVSPRTKQNESKTQEQGLYEFSNSIISDFMDLMLNDIELRVIELCYVLTTHYKTTRLNIKLSELDYLRYFFNAILTMRFKGLRDLNVDNINKWMINFFATFLQSLKKLISVSPRNSNEIIEDLDRSYSEENNEELLRALAKVSGRELVILKSIYEYLLELINEKDDIYQQAEELATLFMSPYLDILSCQSRGRVTEEQIETIYRAFSESLTSSNRQTYSAGDVSTTVMSQTLDLGGKMRRDSHQDKEDQRRRREEEEAAISSTATTVISPDLPRHFQDEGEGEDKKTELPRKFVLRKTDRKPQTTVRDILFNIAAALLTLFAIAVAIYLTLQTAGLAPVIASSMTLTIVASSSGGIGVAAALIKLRKKIAGFFSRLWKRIRGKPAVTPQITETSSGQNKQAPRPAPQVTQQSHGGTPPHTTTDQERDHNSANVMIKSGSGVFTAAAPTRQAANVTDDPEAATTSTTPVARVFK